jgi:prolipoprotein diacylglyceryltransferase
MGYFFGLITMGQILCIPMLMLGAWLIWKARSYAFGKLA